VAADDVLGFFFGEKREDGPAAATRGQRRSLADRRQPAQRVAGRFSAEDQHPVRAAAQVQRDRFRGLRREFGQDRPGEPEQRGARPDQRGQGHRPAADPVPAAAGVIDEPVVLQAAEDPVGLGLGQLSFAGDRRQRRRLLEAVRD